MKATVVGIYGAYYQVRPESLKNQIILAKTRGKLRLRKKSGVYLEPKERHLLTIGDVVEIQVDDGEKAEANILQVYPRQNSFQRATIYQKQTLGANLSAVIIITSVDCPVFNGGLAARLLVETALSKIKPILILNKMDYLEKASKPEYEQALEIMRYFEKNKFSVFYETFSQSISSTLRKEITPGRYLAFGESGVGKSSFINQMVGKKIQATDMNEIVLKGRHITTNPILYEMTGSIELIDVPGIREFGLMHRTKFEISAGFPEFEDIECRYDDCLHLDEPDCGVKAALEQNTFPQFRYEQYCHIMRSMLEHWKPRRGDMRNQR
jgi:ribosome biogenesis GTPase